MQRKRQSRKKKGQALILVVVGLSLFLIAGIGLAIDGSQLYAQKQLAQSAADGTAMATIMSLFNETNSGFGVPPVGGGNPPQTDCSAGGSANLTPCYYAGINGFSAGNGDTVKVDYWSQANAFSQEPGVSISRAAKDKVPLLRVTIIRPVQATLMQIVGGATMNIAAQATAAITTAIAPIPILVLHPTLNGALTKDGNAGIQICGGPKRSIQVNSCAGTGSSIAIPGGGTAACGAGKTASYVPNGASGKIDLTKAGPLDFGGCVTGTGGDFGNFGLPLPPDPPTILLGTAGAYLDPASPIADPLLGVPMPKKTDYTDAPAYCQEAVGAATCPDGYTAPGVPRATKVACPPAGGTTDLGGATINGCTVLYPGIYPSSITPTVNLGDIKGNQAPLSGFSYMIFTPGVYYIKSGGVHFNSNSTGQSQYQSPSIEVWYKACTNSDTETGCGVMFFFAADTSDNSLSVNANAGDLYFMGADDEKKYPKILFFGDRTTNLQQNHSFGGGGQFSVTGTIYFTDTVAKILTTIGSGGYPGIYQGFTLQGGSGNGTVNGEIIVDQLHFGGNPNIRMNLDPAVLPVRYVALVR